MNLPTALAPRLRRLIAPNRLTALHRLLALLIAASAATHPVASLAQTSVNVQDTIAQRVVACAACHGKEGRATRDGYFPRIAGKPADYLYNQLMNFRDGQRRHPAMNHLVANLSDAYLREIADYFASLRLPYPPSQSFSDKAALARGRALVMEGDKTRQIPACASCHGEQLTGRQPSVPSLIGLSRDYLNAQFGAWQTGLRSTAAPDCMATIARRLRPEDIAAVSAWLASQPVAATSAPSRRRPAALPMPCGTADSIDAKQTETLGRRK